MKPIIHPIRSYECSLVLFTVLSQMAVGGGFFLALNRWVPGSDFYSGLQYAANWGLVLLLIGAGLTASLFHLGQPWRAPTAIRNFGRSWLSREIVVFGLFLTLVVLNLLLSLMAATVLERTAPVASLLDYLALATAVIGLGGLIVQGLTYSPVSMPAIANFFPLVLFGLTALIGGGAVATPMKLGLDYGPVWSAGLVLYAVLLLALPGVWVQGGTAMRATARAWLGSPLYWAALAAASAAILISSLMPPAGYLAGLPAVASLLAGRLVFFGQTSHTAGSLGSL